MSNIFFASWVINKVALTEFCLPFKKKLFIWFTYFTNCQKVSHNRQVSHSHSFYVAVL